MTTPDRDEALKALEDLVKAHELMEMCEKEWQSHPGWNCCNGFATQEEMLAEKKYKAAKSSYEYRARFIVNAVKQLLPDLDAMLEARKR